MHSRNIQAGSGWRSERTCGGVFLIQAVLTMTSEREEKNWNELKRVRMSRGTGTLVDPQTGGLASEYTGSNKRAGI